MRSPRRAERRTAARSERPRPRFPIAARLTSILAATAILCLLLAGLVHDQALSRSLSGAAYDRLAGSARATGRLLADHLRDAVVRYTAVSGTPEFRAHLELGHASTLARLTESLAERSGAELLAFVDARGRVRAQHGAPVLGDGTLAAWWAQGVAPPDAPLCVAAPGPAASGGAAAALLPCRVGPGAPPQATLLRLGGDVHVALRIPLATGARDVGTLLAAERLDPGVLAYWSELVGASVAFAEPDAEADDPLMHPVHAFGDLELRVTSSFGPEMATLAQARRHQVIAGLLALAVALGLSALLARDFLRPIREIQRATEEVGRGNLDVRLDSSRGDEIGDVARVLDHTLDRLGSSQRRLRNVQRVARFGDWLADLGRDWVEGSPEFYAALGLPEDGEGSGLGAFLRCFAAGDRAKLDSALVRCTKGGTAIDLDLRRGEGGDARILHVRGRRELGADGRARIEGSVQDVTDRRRAEEQIRFLAFHDSLTGLPNRRFLSERLALAVSPGQSQGFALLFFDLDRFKLVNDTLGHSAGDELLREVAGRLGAFLPPGGRATAARFGGDEFTVLLPGLRDVEEIGSVADRLLRSMAEPFSLQGQEMVVTGSLGIARWPDDGDGSIESLLRCCDTALHRAKENGRNGWSLYDDTMREAASQRWKLESRLRQAVEANQLEVWYQPRVNASDGSLAGFEALLRWNDPEFGGYKPEEFVPIAEETGLIVPLGSWVLRSVLHQMRAWKDEGLPVTWVSVNLSGRQLNDELVAIVREALADSRVAPADLELEITESAVIADAEVGIAVLEQLRALGVRVSLDDFGTGYSSLSYLRTLPISGVKIDRSFVRSIASDDQDAALAGSIVSMADLLGLRVVAEGVETEEQAELLAEMGCDELQGFLFGAAGPPDAARLLLARAPQRKRRERVRRRAGD